MEVALEKEFGDLVEIVEDDTVIPVNHDWRKIGKETKLLKHKKGTFHRFRKVPFESGCRTTSFWNKQLRRLSQVSMP